MGTADDDDRDEVTTRREERRLFLSHSSVDVEQAYALAQFIEASPTARAEGLRVWIDKRELRVGRDWVEQLEQAIANECSAFAVYLTDASIENWVRLEISLALERVVAERKRGRHFPFIPLFVGGRTNIARLPPFARIHHGVEIAADHSVGVEDLVRAVIESRASDPIVLYEEPFLGLDAFDSKDAGLFFGRHVDTQKVLTKLEQCNLLMVIGDSGCGKSSLVRAGIVPAFIEGRIGDRLGRRPDPGAWHAIVMRPKADPFQGLVEGLDRALGGIDVEPALRTENYQRIRSRDPRLVQDALRTSSAPHASHLIVIDQFEELWTQTDDTTRRQCLEFLIALCPESRDGAPLDRTWRAIGTMRRDHFNLCSDVPELHRRLEPKQRAGESPDRRGVFLLGRIADAREIVLKPLSLAGVDETTANELASNVEKDVTDQPGDLALLEMALTETWRRRGEYGGDLVRTYDEIGRVEGALASAADFAFGKLNGSEPSHAEALFMRLVRLGDVASATRRVVLRAELSSAMFGVAEKLVTPEFRRLLVAGGEKDFETFELAHERLSSRWNRYHRWLRNSPDDPTRLRDKRILDRLMDRVFRGNLDDPKEVARGAELQDYRALANGRPDWISPIEAGFIRYSEAQHARARTTWRVMFAAFCIGWILTGVIARKFWTQKRALQVQLAHESAAGFWHRLELRNGINRAEARILQDLASASKAARDAFLERGFETENLADRLIREPFPLIRAVVGIDPQRRASFEAQLERGIESGEPPDGSRRVAALLALCELDSASNVERILANAETDCDDRQRVEIVRKLTFNLSSLRTPDVDRLVMFAFDTYAGKGNGPSVFIRREQILRAFREVCARCSDDAARQLQRSISAQVGDGDPNAGRNTERVWMLALFSERLANPAVWIDRILEASTSAEITQVLPKWGEALVAQRSQASDSQRARILEVFVERSQVGSNPDWFMTFGVPCLMTIREELPEPTLKKALDNIFTLRDPIGILPIDHLGRLFETVRPDVAARLMREVIAEMKSRSLENGRSVMNAVLPVLASRLAPDDARLIGRELVELATAEESVDRRSLALAALRSLPLALTDAHCAALTRVVFPAGFGRDVECSNEICAALHDFQRLLDTSSRTTASSWLLDALRRRRSGSADEVDVPTSTLVALLAQIDPAALPVDSAELIHEILGEEQTEMDSRRAALLVLRENASSEHREAFARTLLMESLETYEIESQELGIEILCPLLEMLPDAALVRVATELFKYPRLPRTDLLVVLRRRFPESPRDATGFWRMIEWLNGRYPNFIDVKGPLLSGDKLAASIRFE